LKAGIAHGANLFSTAVVLFVTVLAPLARLIGTLCADPAARRRAAPPFARVFAFAEKLRPWSMIDVFVFGVFVAYVKLGDLVTIGLAAGVYALLGLTFVLVWMDSALDREAVWERLDYRSANDRSGRDLAGPVGCETCGLVSAPQYGDDRCPGCESVLHDRKPNSIARTWALVIAASLHDIPANSPHRDLLLVITRSRRCRWNILNVPVFTDASKRGENDRGAFRYGRSCRHGNRSTVGGPGLLPSWRGHPSLGSGFQPGYIDGRREARFRGACRGNTLRSAGERRRLVRLERRGRRGSDR